VRAAILGIGEWRPEAIRENDAWPADFAAQAKASTHRELADIQVGGRDDPFAAIVSRHLAPEGGDPFLGTTRRRVADESMTACEAEARAARAALADARVKASEIDVVLSWAAVPDRPTPPSAPRVAHLVGANRAMGIGMDTACATTIAQLLFAASLIESGRAEKILVTGSHLITRAFPLLHPASPSVGDGATAIVVGASERAGILASYGVSQGEYYDAVAWRRQKENDTPWYLPGGAMYVGSYDRSAAQQLVRDTVRFGTETVMEAARRAGVLPSSISVLASVQPRRWVPFAIAEALGLSAEVAPQTFDELAHLGGCGVVTNLLEARRRGLLNPARKGDLPLVCLYAQGAGFTRAAMLLRWSV
jgi:3-oxoacyl-[acyl-carrier-protein] synthase III